MIRKSQIGVLADAFPLPWSHYVLLIGRARSSEALAFYHTEALRGGWSGRLDRQIASQFYERTALSRNKSAMLTRGGQAKPPLTRIMTRGGRTRTARRR
jgi:predicted nuclease of restriction endonuclease-like (RecB) superfamily